MYDYNFRDYHWILANQISSPSLGHIKYPTFRISQLYLLLFLWLGTGRYTSLILAYLLVLSWFRSWLASYNPNLISEGSISFLEDTISDSQIFLLLQSYPIFLDGLQSLGGRVVFTGIGHPKIMFCLYLGRLLSVINFPARRFFEKIESGACLWV